MKTAVGPVPSTDHWRGHPRFDFEWGGWKEWSHFVVVARELTVIVNLSVAEDLDRPGTLVGRATVIVDDGRSDGAVERFEEADLDLVDGRIDARFGPHRLAFRDGAWHLEVALGDRPVQLSLRCVPTAAPTATSRLPFTRPARVQWLVYPRLQVSGTVCIDGRVHTLDRAPGYHDHNWGTFCWGDDFAWEWGFAVPDDRDNPWSLVFSRVSDAGGLRTRSQGLFLWRGDRYHRLFLEDAVTYRPSGHLQLGDALRVPRVGALLRPGGACGLPEQLVVEARKGRDHLACDVALHDVVQVVIPSERDPLGTTAIHEVTGRFQVSGTVLGEPVALAGTAVLEFVRG